MGLDAKWLRLAPSGTGSSWSTGVEGILAEWLEPLELWDVVERMACDL
jgi:hypothetical protein